MRHHRLYTPRELQPDCEIELETSTSHHLCTVLRARAGAPLRLFNAKEDAEYEAELLEPHKRRAIARITQRLDCFRESPLYIHLYQGLSRGDRMDFAIQKATEMGVNEITPILCARSQVRLSGERADKKLDHWQQITVSAAQQSGRCRLPTLNQPLPFAQALRNRVSPSTGIILDTQTSESGRTALQQAKHIDLWIGPEGGFNDEEIQASSEGGLASVSLGPRILRTETATISALTYCQLLAGDIG